MVRWTEQQFADHLSKYGAPGAANAADVSAPPFALPANGAGAIAKGTLTPRKMNKTEAAYDGHLTCLRREGHVLWHGFECIKLRLADDTFYTPDFAVLVRDLSLEMHEVKGFWRDDARVKIKVAAETFPFRFKAVSKQAGGLWRFEEFA